MDEHAVYADDCPACEAAARMLAALRSLPPAPDFAASQDFTLWEQEMEWKP